MDFKNKYTTKLLGDRSLPTPASGMINGGGMYLVSLSCSGVKLARIMFVLNVCCFLV